MAAQKDIKERIMNAFHKELKQIKCHPEIELVDDEGIMHGKFEQNGETYRIVVHIVKEDEEISTSDAGLSDMDKTISVLDSAMVVPDLTRQFCPTRLPEYSPEEGIKIKHRVLKEVREVLAKH